MNLTSSNDKQLNLFDQIYWMNQWNKVKPGNDLNEIRNFRALRIPQNIPKQILVHKNWIPLLYWLSLKPLFISGCIHSENNYLPYRKISIFLNISESNCRGVIRILESLDLLHFNKKDIILHSYKKFCSLFECGEKQYKHKYYFYNNTDIKTFFKSVVLAENYEKQEYIVTEKFCYLKKYLNDSDFTNEKNAEITQTLLDYHYDKGCSDPKQFKNKLKKYKKQVNNEFDNLFKVYQDRYHEEMKVRYYNKGGELIKKPIEHFFDPTNTLSCSGLAKLLNRKSKSTGYYQQRKLNESGFISIRNRYITSEKEDSFNECDYEFEERILNGCTWNKFKKNVVINLSNVLELNYFLKNC